MSDIARMAEVSIGTVSRVLNGKFDVAPELGERVRRVAKQLGYDRRSPNPARAARMPLGTIAYMVNSAAGEVTSDPFQQHFLVGIEKEAHAQGGHVLFTACREEVERGTVPSMVTRRLVTGVIVKGANMDPWLRLVSRQVPLVLIMAEEMSRSVPTVSCDNRGAVFQVLSHLRELGHQRIGFFFEKEIDGNISLHHREREAAFRFYAAQLGCATQADYVQTLARSPRKEATQVETADRALHHFLALKQRRPTAIVCASDFHAFALLKVAMDRGLRVPRDLSVASFMNTPASEHAHPPLTSVHLFGEEVGRAAVELLRTRIADPAALPRHVTIGTRLVARASTGAALS